MDSRASYRMVLPVTRHGLNLAGTALASVLKRLPADSPVELRMLRKCILVLRALRWTCAHAIMLRTGQAEAARACGRGSAARQSPPNRGGAEAGATGPSGRAQSQWMLSGVARCRGTGDLPPRRAAKTLAAARWSTRTGTT